MSPSFGTMSFKSTSISTRNKTLDPTIINNDFEVPLQTETRIRPAPLFVQKSEMKPKVLQAIRKEDNPSSFKTRSRSI